MISGFNACYSDIMAARLDTPLIFPAFTVFFDQRKLDDIRNHYGADLFRECYAAALEEVTA